MFWLLKSEWGLELLSSKRTKRANKCLNKLVYARFYTFKE